MMGVKLNQVNKKDPRYEYISVVIYPETLKHNLTATSANFLGFLITLLFDIDAKKWVLVEPFWATTNLHISGRRHLNCQTPCDHDKIIGKYFVCELCVVFFGKTFNWHTGSTYNEEYVNLAYAQHRYIDNLYHFSCKQETAINMFL